MITARRALPVVLAAVLPFAFVAVAHAGNPGCDNRQVTSCVSGGLASDQEHGQFHGLIMVPGEPGVLNAAAHAGTQPGCGDCEWTLLQACVTNIPANGGNPTTCNGSGQAPTCGPNEVLYRLYLSTTAIRNQLVDQICLGPTKQVIAVGQQAALDVQRYLKDVTPLALLVTVQPPHGVLANLPAYFVVRPPTDLRPQPFGNGQITETITIKPAHYLWHWGDGSADLATDDPGAPYPDGTVTHTYVTAGHVRGAVTTRWAASYTITVPGAGTLGPYDATGGQISKTQSFDLTVTAARSHLVSHG